MSHKKHSRPARPLATDLESPWLEQSEELAASAREIDPLTNALGLKFQGVQQEAQEDYMASEEDPGSSSEKR